MLLFGKPRRHYSGEFLAAMQPGLCPFAQMDETIYSAEQCQSGFFAWSHESTDMQKNSAKRMGSLRGEHPCA
jgi:hypothetical protein